MITMDSGGFENNAFSRHRHTGTEDTETHSFTYNS